MASQRKKHTTTLKSKLRMPGWILTRNASNLLTVPMPILSRVPNLTWAVDVFYEEQDGYTHVVEGMKNYIASFFINPIT